VSAGAAQTSRARLSPEQTTSLISHHA
jgi:hypothetical protein